MRNPIRLDSLCSVAVWFCFATPALCQPPESEPTGNPAVVETQADTATAETEEVTKPTSDEQTDTGFDVDSFFGGPSTEKTEPEVEVDDRTDAESDAESETETGAPVPSEAGDDPPVDSSDSTTDPISESDLDALMSDLESQESDGDDPPTDLIDGYEPARRLALLHQRPLLVIFGAQWCGWCRKLEAELESPQSDEIRQQWVVAKVDVDDQPVLAQQMDVGSLPGIRIVDASGDVVASRTGYLESAELQSWLEENLQQADPKVQQVLFATGVPSPSDIQELVAMLRQRSPSLRASASRRLQDHRSVTAAAVVDQLRTGPLSSQLTSLEILEAWDAPVGELDPWIPETIDEERLQPLLQWLRSAPTDASEQTDATDKKMDEQTVVRIVRQLIDAPSARHGELTEQAVAGGSAVADRVEQMLTTLDSLSDDQRQRLREVRYRILAGPAARIESSGLLRSIARLDGPTRREAAERLISTLTSQDQPLIDDLSRDSDPLVRELAVTAQSRVGALTQGDRLQRLLGDESPSVRTAVLRQLAENPTDEVTARLVEYLDTESDEDLLVYATKTLGQLAENKIASDALAALLEDSRWRVRAASLDAIQQFLEESSSTSWFSDTPTTAPPSISAGVLAALGDEDAFVASKATTVLPYVLSRDTAEQVAEYMLQDKTQFDAVFESVDTYRRDRQFKPLTELAADWLDGDDPQQIADATRLLTRIAPTALRYKLADLLVSPQRAVRVAALRASLPCLAEFRDQQLTEEQSQWQQVAARDAAKQFAEIPLLHPIPEAFLPVPDDVQPSPATEESSDSLAQKDDGKQTSPAVEPSEPTSLDLVDGFFGAAPTNDAADQTDDAKDNPPADENKLLADDAAPMAKETEPSQNGGVFDWVGRMFGGKPSDQSAAEPVREQKQDNADVAKNKLDQDRLGLGTYWMHRWQNQRDTIQRPTWIRHCEPLVQELTNSDDPVEKIWAQAVWLAHGNIQQRAALQQQFASDDLPEDAPQMLDLVTWLPTSERFDWLKQIDVDWNELSKESTNQLREVTQFDLDGAPAWFAKQITEHEIEQSKSLTPITILMLESLIGRHAAQELPERTADQLTLDSSQSLSVPKNPIKYAGQLPAIRWLLEQYEQSTSDIQKAVLLSVLSTASRKHAIAEALVVLDETEEQNQLTRVATALALSDLRALSARRAVALLEHPVDEVAEQALIRLVSIDYGSGRMGSGLPVPTLYYETPERFALQELDRPLPAEALRRFQSDEPNQTSALADLLRVAAGEDLDPLEILRPLRGREQIRALMAVALARAGRTDPAAMQVYRLCVENIGSKEATAVQHALRNVKDERVSSLRRKLLMTTNGVFP